TIRWSIPYPRIPSSRSMSFPSRNRARVGTTSTAYSSHRGFSSSSRYTAAKRHGLEVASFSNSAWNRRLNGHHVAQNMTTVGSGDSTIDFWKPSGSRTFSMLPDKTRPMAIKLHPWKFVAPHGCMKQRHIPGPPDTRARSRLSKGWNGFFARRVGGGPLLLRSPRVTGRRDVRHRPGCAGPRLRPRTRRGDPPDRRPRLSGRALARTLRGRRRRPSHPGTGEAPRPGRARDPRRQGDGPPPRGEQGESGRASRPRRPRD